MIDIFDIQDKTVIPAVACYMTPELKAIIDYYPDEYLKVLQYVFAMTCNDSRNWYLNLSDDEREDVVLADIKPFNFSLEDVLVQEAIDKCNKLYETPILRNYLSVRAFMEKTSEALKSEELTFGKDGNATELRNMAKSAGELWKTYKDFTTELMQEQSVARGKIKRSYDQMPSYKYTKEDNNSQKDNI